MPPARRLFSALMLAFLACLTGVAAHAGSSPAYVSDRITARLITAENGVAPDAKVISAALEVQLADGWKTYWKSPGAVGYPASIDWTGSSNLEETEFQWPTPKRFRAFDIENYGYEKSVIFPIKLMISQPGETLVLTAQTSLLVCAELCVPEDFTLSLLLPSGTAIDRDSAAQIAEAAALVPIRGAESGISVTAAGLEPGGKRLSVDLASEAPFRDLNLFPDLGLDAAFGPPEISLGNDKQSARVSFEVLSAPETLPNLRLTVSDGERAAVFSPEMGEIGALAAPVARGSVAWFFVLAFIGGVILNVMPCVLPVLTIKFASALKARDQSAARVRSGFVMSALGVMAFMWALASVLLAIRAGGGSIGWGIQFQSPVFLAIMTTIVTLFAANLFGLFEIELPQSLNTKLANTGDGTGLTGDFATGALAAVLATPCSAPFLGTAVTFALSGSAIETLTIFTALGLGLGLPYLLVAIWPASIRALPKPGAWMNTVRLVMGLLLATTAAWLLSVLWGVAGGRITGLVALCMVGLALALWIVRKPALRVALVAVLAVIGIALPAVLSSPAPVQSDVASNWGAFRPEAITAHVTSGQIVFVDITADWCLSCKANKSLVLDREPVTNALNSEGVVTMQGDWTRADDTILSFLTENGRYGIPFDIVYGPGAPNGIALQEILTTNAVMDAIEKAGG